MGERVINESEEAALDYARRGWKVFPVYEISPAGICACDAGAGCNSPGKHPRVRSWTKESSVNGTDIASWWKRWPTANVGLVCGAGLFVLDVDDGKGGSESLEKLQSRHEQLPETRTHATGNGHHLVFTCGKDFIPNSVGKIGAGLDIRGDGGYVVAPPSLHISGAVYQLELGLSEDPVPAPGWLIDAVQKETSGSTGGEAKKDNFVTLIHGQRNNYFTSLAGTLRRRGMGVAAITAALLSENQTRCSPPMEDSEVIEIAGKAARWSPEFAATMEKAPGVSPDQDWRALLRQSGTGFTKDQHNIALFLTHHDEWKGALAWDEMANRVIWNKLPPNNGGVLTVNVGDPIQDHDEVLIQSWFAMYLRMEIKKESAIAGLEVAARNNSVHPVRDWLKMLKWDGKQRVESWLKTYLEAAEDRYTKLVGTYWLVSAVARVMRPGCQADHVLVLEGPVQGEGKSTGMGILFGDKWYLPTLPRIDNKDALQCLNGKWGVEIAELDSFRGAASTKIKDFTSQRFDVYRPSYGRYVVERKRQCVFLGTTNEERYLNDPTGARRFWPVSVGLVNRKKLADDREQIWAEAYHLYKSGSKWWPERDMSHVFAEAQEERFNVDAWENLVAAYLKRRTQVTIGEIMEDCLQVRRDRWSKADQARAGIIVKRLRWVKTRKLIDGCRQYVYINQNTPAELHPRDSDDPDY